MTAPKRMAIRAAMLIHEHVAGHAGRADTIELPEYSWQQLQRLRRQLVRAHQRGWHLAAKTLFRNLADALQRAEYELEGAVRRIETYRKPRQVSSPAEIYRDILDLEQEFDGLQLDRSSHELVVTTDPIVLDSIDLGRFEVRLDWSQVGSPSQPYRVVALDPHPAARNEDVTHPHVQDERLCEGDGRAAIASALSDGRLYDFFTLVFQVLHTYGRGSAYVELDKWDGVLCDDCGDSMDEEESYGCQRCGRTLCSSCAGSCPKCQESYCADCLCQCADCGEDHCRSCLAACPACRQRFCEDCLDEGLCRSCLEKTHEEDQDDDSDDDPEFKDTCPAGREGAEPADASV